MAPAMLGLDQPVEAGKAAVGTAVAGKVVEEPASVRQAVVLRELGQPVAALVVEVGSAAHLQAALEPEEATLAMGGAQKERGR